ncbi:hypothetical protein MLAC_46530 [Mycobacterium lacus]|uniref:Uncharacterized protein n=1 Tax=Mycobacterium lacus TaxID=169765 RepID=A0A7I7NSV0_9MYCO|nr:hypothetical protein MLAC_46530 [Mycobacterium lacus]
MGWRLNPRLCTGNGVTGAGGDGGEIRIRLPHNRIPDNHAQLRRPGLQISRLPVWATTGCSWRHSETNPPW